MNRLFGETYKGRRVLVTGHTGFKGSWLALWLYSMGAEVVGYSLAPETEPNHFDLLDIKCDSITGDIRDNDKLKSVILKYQPFRFRSSDSFISWAFLSLYFQPFVFI